MLKQLDMPTCVRNRFFTNIDNNKKTHIYINKQYVQSICSAVQEFKITVQSIL